MRVMFRCDASKDQGLGHLFRCVAVAEAAVDAGWEAIFCGDVDNPLGKALLAELGMSLLPAPDTPEELANLARAQSVDVVHVDTYKEMGSVLPVLADAGIVLSSIEDGAFGRRPAHLVIDASPGSEGVYRTHDGSVRYLRGLKAVPLRRSMLDDDKRPVQDIVGNVLVIIGGTDASNVTEQVIDAWAATGLDSTCHVVGYEGRTRRQGGQGQQYRYHERSLSINELFASMDLVISAAGTTTWELAALGIPAALVQAVDNQRANYDYATASGAAVGLGVVVNGILDPSVDSLRRFAQDAQARARAVSVGRSLVDGHGGDRIVAQWRDLVELGEALSARRATIDDSSMLFEWRNDPGVRSVSRNTDELSFEKHHSWLATSLENTHGRLLLIVEHRTGPVGTVRFDRLTGDDDIWEVSITAAGPWRGRGVSRTVLASAEAYFRNVLIAPVTLLAEMRVENERSYKLFSAAGYANDKPQRSPTGEWHRLTKVVHPASGRTPG